MPPPSRPNPTTQQLHGGGGTSPHDPRGTSEANRGGGVDRSTATCFAGKTKVEREECFYEWASAYAKEAASSPHRPFVIAKSQSYSRSSGSHLRDESAEPHRQDPSDSETDTDTDDRESPSVSPRPDRYDRTYSNLPRKPRVAKTEDGSNIGTGDVNAECEVQNLVNDGRMEERAVATVSSPKKTEVKRPPLFIQRLIQESRESRDTEAEEQSGKSSRSALQGTRSVVASSPCYQQFQEWAAQAAAHTMSNMMEAAVCTTHMTTLSKTTTTTAAAAATTTTTTTGSRPVSASSCATSAAPSRRPASAGSRMGGSSKSRGDYCQPWSVSLSTFFNVNTGLPVPPVKTFGRTSRTFFEADKTSGGGVARPAAYHEEDPTTAFSAHKRRRLPGTIVLVYDFYAKLQAPAIQLCGKARSYDEAKRADETLSQGELTSLLKDFKVVPNLLSREELAHIWGSHSREEGHVKFTELTIVEAVECLSRIALVVFSKQMTRPLFEELTRLIAEHEQGREDVGSAHIMFLVPSSPHMGHKQVCFFVCFFCVCGSKCCCSDMARILVFHSPLFPLYRRFMRFLLPTFSFSFAIRSSLFYLSSFGLLTVVEV
jgi:hypothetical protein